MPSSQHIDLTLIKGYLEALDLAVIQQMLDLYIQQSALYLLAINSAVVDDDQKSWQEQCHKMKGAAASAGLSQVHQKLIVLEKSTEDSETKNQHLQALRLLNQQAIAEFQQWLAEQ
ncbi:Hpt domain-containing protein [Colwellia sp. BRX10-3]|uniref:Hpt domain-containing protein n=1 Tax=Colwellia sp. BRX10-3 TaxID=2759844 RepID=UPI0015F622E6|nr:Hpt domain-containing protein [Colwellia sp. BRX10-3]MBA6389817.1 Hpt domain-containing protein [Colwellia sp. BRX10-3]